MLNYRFSFITASNPLGPLCNYFILQGTVNMWPLPGRTPVPTGSPTYVEIRSSIHYPKQQLYTKELITIAIRTLRLIMSNHHVSFQKARHIDIKLRFPCPTRRDFYREP
jgi:hypothetical protein